jgi:hypothetical protein
MMNAIPPMTHPLSRHWDQPPTGDILLDDTHALMSQAAFDALHTYSTSLPTGVYDGKMWKRERIDWQPGYVARSTGDWWLCWYAPANNPDCCAVEMRRILIL